MKERYGLEQARARLPHIASEARAGHTSVITRHGKPVAAVVPIAFLDAMPSARAQGADFLSLRGSGRHLWSEGAVTAVARLRDEWQG